MKESVTETSCSISRDGGLFGTHTHLRMLCRGGDFSFADHFVECLESGVASVMDIGRTYTCFTDVPMPASNDTVIL
jgi:hypothetical protein